MTLAHPTWARTCARACQPSNGMTQAPRGIAITSRRSAPSRRASSSSASSSPIRQPMRTSFQLERPELGLGASLPGVFPRALLMAELALRRHGSQAVRGHSIRSLRPAARCRNRQDGSSARTSHRPRASAAPTPRAHARPTATPRDRSAASLRTSRSTACRVTARARCPKRGRGCKGPSSLPRSRFLRPVARMPSLFYRLQSVAAKLGSAPSKSQRN